jgi:hypothetical protein
MDELLNATGADWVIGLPENGELAELGRNDNGVWPISSSNPVVSQLDRLLTDAGITGRSRGVCP